ncbi:MULTISPECIES: ABC transporter permease [Rhodococcus]|uniref:ABC transporter permease n=1 Tax=Rhodococcus globerulus TaxID=33008 RepID=UPI001C5745D6|nr:ABC transporter permease [Rhodococcus globerulus]QXV99934.1 ABC transporter permease [Rhodococcus globerulus]
MLITISKRLLTVIPMLWAIATMAFLLVNLMPGSPGRTILGESATPEAVEALNEQMGYNRPLVVQYWSWLTGVLTGDFGTSLQTGRPAITDVNSRLPITLSVVIGAVILTVLVGLTFGVLSAMSSRRIDRGTQAFSSLMMSVPSFWLGALLVLVFSVKLGMFPSVGYVPIEQSFSGWLSSITLPAISVGAVGVAAISRQTRGAMLDVLGNDYIRTLRATGIPHRSLVFRHALRNASIPIVTSVGFQFIGLLGGTVIVEQVFALNGLGALTLQAVNAKDLPMILTVVICTTTIVLAVNLLVDIANSWLNPKMRRS